jgi:hypothetical protein
VLLGQGDGTFLPAVNYPAGIHPTSVAVGDFNGDGKLDLAAANQGTFPYTDGSVSILLGKGDGTLLPAQTLSAGAGPRSVAVGDFNGDGKLDLAVAGYGFEYHGNYPYGYWAPTDENVRVLLGQGDGSFLPAQTFPAGSGPSAVAVGDFNGDSKQDLAIAGGGVNVLLGQGDGTFLPALNFPVGYNPRSVAVGDFNGDGKQDLAVANSTYPNGTVSVLLGQGDGTFQSAVNYAAGSYPWSVVVADFNGDGKQDLAVAAPTVRVLLGNGDGTFQTTNISYVAGASPTAVAVGDFNGDGFPDLATVSNDVSILLNDATWSMSAPGAADRRVDSGPRGPAPPSLSFPVAAVAASATAQPQGIAPSAAAAQAPFLAPGLVDALFAAPRGEVPARAASGLALVRHAAYSRGRWQPLFDDLDLLGQARAPLPWEEP